MLKKLHCTCTHSQSVLLLKKRELLFLECMRTSLCKKYAFFDPSISSPGHFLFYPLTKWSASLNILPKNAFLKCCLYIKIIAPSHSKY